MRGRRETETYRGASFLNFVNHRMTRKHLRRSATLNFNQLRKRVSAEDYFIDFKFEYTSASAIRCRQQNFISLCPYMF